MCVGALVHARVREVVYGATEPKTGALVSAVRALDIPGLNHRFAVTGGVLEASAARSSSSSSGTSAGEGTASSGTVSVAVHNGASVRRACAHDRRGTEVVVTGAPRKRLVG